MFVIDYYNDKTRGCVCTLCRFFSFHTISCCCSNQHFLYLPLNVPVTICLAKPRKTISGLIILLRHFLKFDFVVILISHSSRYFIVYSTLYVRSSTFDYFLQLNSSVMMSCWYMKVEMNNSDFNLGQALILLLSYFLVKRWLPQKMALDPLCIE